MCVQCVANGAPYVAGSLVALKAMGLRARRSRLRSSADAVVPAGVDATDDPAR